MCLYYIVSRKGRILSYLKFCDFMWVLFDVGVDRNVRDVDGNIFVYIVVEGEDVD